MRTTRSAMRKFFFEHSLSLALIAGWAIHSWLAWWVSEDQNNFWYDWNLMNAGGFGGSAILVVLAKYLWERDSDPATPPKSTR